MNTRLTGVVLLVFLVSLLACSKPKHPEDLRYKKEIIKERLAKDQFLRSSPSSPLLLIQRLNFKGLKYFAPDISYRTKAKFTPLASSKSFKIMTSSGRKRLYIVKGRLDFTRNGKKLTLTAYEEKDLTASHPDDIFVPFTDLTSGRQSYGAGRYLEFNSPGRNIREVILDFNLAFNPYCAYNHNYSCPIPPPGNHLDIAVKAGEKKFH
ncbi:MAG: DUF1684 domain-containing protein [Deltaproteobacteria bacterium]|nr:DUF1684 domain-containing protein [Deltaproteobacteria bacterium]